MNMGKMIAYIVKMTTKVLFIADITGIKYIQNLWIITQIPRSLMDVYLGKITTNVHVYLWCVNENTDMT